MRGPRTSPGNYHATQWCRLRSWGAWPCPGANRARVSAGFSWVTPFSVRPVPNWAFLPYSSTLRMKTPSVSTNITGLLRYQATYAACAFRLLPACATLKGRRWSAPRSAILQQSPMCKIILTILAAAALAAAQPAQLTDIRQLTHGGENAEAYWAPDGKRLIFQTTRPPYDCDQIFIMNADGSDQHLVSTGKGRTTCGYFLGDNKHIVYASTHLADAACPASPDRSRGYVWGVFAGYDIFLATDDGKIEKRLTDTPGYDAEATVNWKTGTIVYTSLASHDLDLWTD